MQVTGLDVMPNSYPLKTCP